MQIIENQFFFLEIHAKTYIIVEFAWRKKNVSDNNSFIFKRIQLCSGMIFSSNIKVITFYYDP